MSRLFKWVLFSSMFALSSVVMAQQLQLGRPSFGGNGCDGRNSSATLSPDGQQISILFDQFSAEAGGRFGLDVDRKNCDVAIPVKVPQGYSIALFYIDYRGFASVPQSGRLRFSAEYTFAGKSSRRHSKEFLGPMADNFIFQNELRAEMNVWSACGADVVLRSQLNLVAEANGQEELTQGSIDSIDIQSGITYNFQYRRCNDVPLQPTPQPSPQPTPPPQHMDQNIHGWIDGLQNLGEQGVVLNGWACAKNVNSSIAVHVYINGPAGQGQFVKGIAANVNSESAVSQQCQTSGVAHRFSIAFSKDEVLRFANSTIWIHGISPVGLTNLTIGNSGRISFPRAQQKLHGGILQVSAEGSGGNQVMGWACLTGEIRKLDIEVFIGGPVGVGTFAGSSKTEFQFDEIPSADSTCGRFNPSVGYSAVVSKKLVDNHMNQPVYAYAIDPNSGQFFQLDGSGQHQIVYSPGDRF